MFEKWKKKPPRKTFFEYLNRQADAFRRAHPEVAPPRINDGQTVSRIVPINQTVIRIVDTGAPTEKLDPQKIAKALGAEIIGRLPRRRR